MGCRQGGKRTRFAASSASLINFSESAADASRHNFLNSSTAARDSLNRCSVLIRATTSVRWRRFAFVCGLQEYIIVNTSHQDGTNAGGRERWGGEAGRGEERRTYSSAFSSSSKRILSAVATPVVCTLPQSLHLSHPTQSIILVTFLKCALNSSFKTYIPPSNQHN